ncbi:hypothetical protein ACPTGO_31035, partial [Pseudomonas aeruginosa]|uniref:hypothetical protein n=1 Tax=Pseudomonas aeruginosa TaxID=287 RepID=UPI003CC555D0
GEQFVKGRTKGLGLDELLALDSPGHDVRGALAVGVAQPELATRAVGGDEERIDEVLFAALRGKLA